MPLDESTVAQVRRTAREMKAERYAQITGRDALARVLRRGNRGDPITQGNPFHGSAIYVWVPESICRTQDLISLSDSRFEHAGDR